MFPLLLFYHLESCYCGVLCVCATHAGGEEKQLEEDGFQRETIKTMVTH